MFQSTRPRGARPEKSVYTDVHGQRFNPRARVGRDWGLRLVNPASRPFQSTRPRGARHAPGGSFFVRDPFQSTRPRGARRWRIQEDVTWQAVSIHAPAWGATPTCPCCTPHAARFNPRARVGRDGFTPCLLTMTLFCFNPRARVGRDRTHDSLRTGARCFNPRARVGRDANSSAQWQKDSSFNPRARVGRDPLCPLYGRQIKCFNPRARVGRDSNWWVCPACSMQFQSTRPRGARRSHHNSLRDKDFFYEIREPMSPIDPKGTGQVATTQKANEINKLLKCEPSRESRTA